MDSFIPFILDHAPIAHYVIFALFMLAGINIPISEDLLIILSGILASTIVPENVYKLFIAVFLGAYLSDWIPFWIGRKWGAHIWRVRWFARMVKPEKLNHIQNYYKRYGVMTLLVGRFIPFGVRNCLFAAAGMAQISFPKFMLFDGIACFLSNSTLFLISYYCGRNYETLLKELQWINTIIFSLFVVALIAFIWYKKTRKKTLEKEVD